MAKDAKGHGSEKHGAGGHIRKAAANALAHGADHDSVRQSLQDAAAAELLRVGGNPKSDVVPAHGGASGRFSQHNTPYHGMVKVGNGYRYTGPHPDRLTARDAARAVNPKAKSVATGYGHGGPHFDIRSHSKYE